MTKMSLDIFSQKRSEKFELISGQNLLSICRKRIKFLHAEMLYAWEKWNMCHFFVHQKSFRLEIIMLYVLYLQFIQKYLINYLVHSCCRLDSNWWTKCHFCTWFFGKSMKISVWWFGFLFHSTLFVLFPKCAKLTGICFIFKMC